MYIHVDKEKRSEVARILAQIQAEYEACNAGLSGFATGSARHAFITARTERLYTLHNDLLALVGDNAMALVEHGFEKSDESKHLS